jgi:hypothetical protein
MQALLGLLSLWFVPRDIVTRRTYLLSGRVLDHVERLAEAE